MGSEREISAWEDLGPRRAVTAAPSMLPNASSRAADHTDLIPSSDEEVLTELTSCLQLVAPVGMGEDEQDTWFEAALKALAGIPLGLLQRGAAAARLRADHPAKIIPTIIGEIGDAWAWRKQHRAATRAEPEQVSKHDAISADEAREICERLGVGSFAKPAQPARRPQPVAWSDPTPLGPDQIKVPNRDDYQKLFGIDPETQHARAEAKQRAEQEADQDLLAAAYRLQADLYGWAPDGERREAA